MPPEYRTLWEQNEAQPVIKYPAEILRQVAEPVERVGKKTRELLARMEEVLRKANGIGLAAPQVGVSERVILISPNGRKAIPLINPIIVHLEGLVIGEEGCLSLPALYGEVERSAIAEVEALDENGDKAKYRLEGLAARVVQHEIDHLDGVLFLDKADPATFHWAWPAGAERP